MKYYHGTKIKELKEIIPNFKYDNTLKKAVIYFTRNKTLALFYIWDRPYKYASFSINNDGLIEYTEEFPNQLYEFYYGISGSIYVCNSNTIYESHLKGVYISEVPVEVMEVININNAYEELLKAEKLGNIIIKRYETLSTEEEQKIRKDRVRAIHMQGLLTTKNQGQKCMAVFMQDKFPLEWEIALKNTKEEIREMINQWRISIGLNPLE